jgi:hypothetical protein
MPRRQYEDRVTRGCGTRAAGHEPLTIVHSHQHSDGHGGTHTHLHAHTGDSNHTGAGHPASPGNPDADMPAVQLNSAAPGDVHDRDILARARAYLTGLGVDLGGALTELGHVRVAEAHRVRRDVDRAESLAVQLVKAERALLFEARGFNEGATGFTAARLGEARERVAQLTGELEAACCDDLDLARSVRRSVA